MSKKKSDITNFKCLHLNVFIDMIKVLRDDNVHNIEIG